MTAYVTQERLTCLGEGEQPRHTATRSYCPVCFRPVRYKILEDQFGEVEMVMRHRVDGKSGTRQGIPNKTR